MGDGSRMTARKRFAQHFLEPAWVAKLVEAFDPQPTDVVVEIGPGRGALTRPLAARVQRLLAVEIDRDLARALDAQRPANVTVVEGDVLAIDLGARVAAWLQTPLDAGHRVRVIGNLPYNISTPILFRLLDLSRSGGLADATLMLQKEVADRLMARSGTKEYGVLTILTGLRAEVTRLLALPAGAFRPPPKVLSSVVRLAFRPSPVSIRDESIFTSMVRALFTQRRKTVLNALKPFAERHGASAAERLADAGIDGRRRPETLQLVDLARLADSFGGPVGLKAVL
jgi:16S rRNA (adenine1518-N6/adenine1519-N6)-dimethyltransferase